MGAATEGARGAMPPHFNFQTNKDPSVSVSNIRDIASCGFSKIIPSRNFTIFTVYGKIFREFFRDFVFCNDIREIDYFTLDLLKRSHT